MIYGLTGIYALGSNGFKWKPEFGAGVLLPLGSKWAAIVDGTVGLLRVNEITWAPGDTNHLYAVFYMRNPHLVNEDI